jgi:SAM-dependent methyltransferase
MDATETPGDNLETMSAPDESLAETCEVLRARHIIEAARQVARSTPAPRGAPFYGLDADAAYDLRVLDAFCARGIFRKYEFALEMGSGLGGRARWLAARSGCRIAGVDARLPAIAAARLLNGRASMDDQVRFQVGRLDALPLGSRVFTHVWAIDLPRSLHTDDVLAEGWRVLRPGGHFALLCEPLVSAERTALLHLLVRVGFINLDTREVVLSEPPPAYRLAGDRLRAVAPAEPAPPPRDHWRGLHVFATRPA